MIKFEQLFKSETVLYHRFEYDKADGMVPIKGTVYDHIDQNYIILFDFIEDQNANPLIVEVSYCYLPAAVRDCSGHWDKDLNWHEGQMWPQDAIIEDIVSAVCKE